jgi:hypothetical protein
MIPHLLLAQADLAPLAAQARKAPLPAKADLLFVQEFRKKHHQSSIQIQMKKISVIILIALSACTTQPNLAKFLASDEGKAIVAGARDAASSAIQQYAATGKVGGKETAKAAISGASAVLRTTQSTADVAKPTAIEQAIKQGSGVPAVSGKLAPKVAAIVAKGVQNNKNVPPNLVNEAAAHGLDQAVKNTP